jgi:hypothetical protein
MPQPEEEREPVAQTPDTPVEQETATDDSNTENAFEWNGEQYDKSSVMEVVENFGNWKNAQASITRRNQADAEARREVEQMKSEYAEKLAALQDQSTTSTQEDYDEVARIRNDLNELKGMIKPMFERQSQAEAQLQREHEYENALSAYSKYPMADLNEMRAFMDSKGLGPAQADVAYQALYGYNMGVMKGSHDVKARAAAPVMGSTGYGASPGWTGPTDVPRGRKPMSETSVEELVQQALNDPEI